MPRSPDAAQRAVLHGVVRCRAGAVTNAGVSRGPGSAKQHCVLHRARETLPPRKHPRVLRNHRLDRIDQARGRFVDVKPGGINHRGGPRIQRFAT